ncbi:MAG: aromatic ring-hydroxylating dioxygenase subunit alpha [Alphaproteobacteria bacterium]|nr:aromatic ring-hydroxylating dioxygenase subunit alpha [Alphaproteobacteria bacterium]
MLSHTQNKLVTETGPGTPCGEVLRRYWQPAALVEELEQTGTVQAGARPVKPVTLLGEALVLFRDEAGNYGLVARHCPHRGADLAYGRCEDGGLRCPFHGWLFAADGACLEQPAEPAGSTFYKKIRAVAYPCRVAGGVVFAYLGPGDPPPLPNCDAVAAPDAFSFAFKGYLECNWLQSLEVGIDPAHASFLHRFLTDDQREHGLQFEGGPEGSDLPVTQVLRDNDCPRIDVEETGYGMRIFALRELSDAETHVRVTNLLFPNAIVIPMSRDMTITQWQVPVDDTNTYWYAIFSAFETQVDKKTMRDQRLELYTLPDYKPRVGRFNGYGFDPVEQETQTYTGMGHDINVHDQWAVESMGPIQDRTAEHLGTSDKGITAYRRMLLAAIDAPDGDALPGLNGSPDRPVAVDTMAPAASWQDHWPQVDRARRQRSAWADD